MRQLGVAALRATHIMNGTQRVMRPTLALTRLADFHHRLHDNSIRRNPTRTALFRSKPINLSANRRKKDHQRTIARRNREGYVIWIGGGCQVEGGINVAKWAETRSLRCLEHLRLTRSVCVASKW